MKGTMKYGQLIIRVSNRNTSKITTYKARKLIIISRRKDPWKITAASNIE